MDFFQLKKNNSDVKTEFTAGLTTFLTMMYIVPVNGFILADAGLPMDAVVTATAIITILATLFSGIWSNTPIAMSVGMGLNAYFSYGLVLGMKIPWQTALGIVFISGLLFVILSFTNFRVWIMTSIPLTLRRAISAGIGTFIAFIGLKQMGMIVDNPATLVSLGDFSKEMENNILNFSLNKCVANIYTLLNYLEKNDCYLGNNDLSKKVLICLFPIIPGLSLTVSKKLFNLEVTDLFWPKVNKTLIEEREINLPIQIKGKFISTIDTKKGYNEKDLLEKIYNIEKINKRISGKKIIKIINVQDKIINIITD